MHWIRVSLMLLVGVLDSLRNVLHISDKNSGTLQYTSPLERNLVRWKSLKAAVKLTRPETAAAMKHGRRRIDGLEKV